MIQIFNKNNIFTEDAINIFVDASVYNLKSGGNIQDSIVCPGFVVVNKDTILDSGCDIIHNSTNNVGELNAIYMGLIQAINYAKYYKKIRIFSDSQTSVFAIRDRIFNWSHFYDDKGNLYGYDKKTPINNLSYILQSVYFILENNLSIEIYHQKGHVNLNDTHSIYNAMNVFQKSNSQFLKQITKPELVDFYKFVQLISFYNGKVDDYTRTALHSLLEKNNNLINPISYVYRKELFDYDKYLNLLHKV